MIDRCSPRGPPARSQLRVVEGRLTGPIGVRILLERRVEGGPLLHRGLSLRQGQVGRRIVRSSGGRPPGAVLVRVGAWPYVLQPAAIQAQQAVEDDVFLFDLQDLVAAQRNQQAIEPCLGGVPPGSVTALSGEPLVPAVVALPTGVPRQPRLVRFEQSGQRNERPGRGVGQQQLHVMLEVAALDRVRVPLGHTVVPRSRLDLDPDHGESAPPASGHSTRG